MGGLNWGQLIFNWHPLLMVIGLIFCSVSSMVTYRTFPLPKSSTKPIHVVLHSLALICVTVGLSAVIIGNNYKSENTSGMYYANFYSIHSFVGLAAVILYTQNYILGFIHFLVPSVTSALRRAYMPTHKVLGIFSFFAACMAALTGLMELATEYNCSYSVSRPDVNPVGQYHLLSAGCRTMNGIAVLILVTALCAGIALWDVRPPPDLTETRITTMEDDSINTEGAVLMDKQHGAVRYHSIESSN